MQAFHRLLAKDIQKRQLTEIAVRKLVKLTSTFSDSSIRWTIRMGIARPNEMSLGHNRRHATGFLNLKTAVERD